MYRICLALILIVCGLVTGVGAHAQTIPLGSLLKKTPEQCACDKTTVPIAKNGWKLQPLASFTVEARVLGKAVYTKDFAATIATYDLALGWGTMSDPATLEKFSITQDNRFYEWRYWSKIPLDDSEIKSHSANMHLIPADDAVLKKLRDLPTGALIRIEGYLVEASHPRARKSWRSSLSRDDEGEGACEIVYATSLVDLPSEPNVQK
ncbi:hypothetical protein BH11VER1_BH11VER1_12940 [soil metagenome]